MTTADRPPAAGPARHVPPGVQVMTGQPATGPARLSRTSLSTGPAAPVRILHLGLGNFFRAHQAWYTQHLPDAAGWGIAAFTGRRAALADALRPQDGLYTLITRGSDGDRTEVIESLVAAHPAGDHDAWLRYFRSPGLAAVTMTVTEAAYRLDDRDIATLRADPAAPVRSVPARLLAGLIARDRAGRQPIAILPCDNLPGNGDHTARLVRDLASRVGGPAEEAVDRTATFANSVVDRITPRATAADARTARAATGLVDAAPVVTEPFSEWVISGALPAAGPRWERGGATIVDDVTPYQQRKLLLLNGGHSLLAYLGGARGHDTVAAACADPVCTRWLHRWWEEAGRVLAATGVDLAGYRAALRERFANPRIEHRLGQIAADGSQKLPVRVLPVLRAAPAGGGDRPLAAIHILAAWVCHLRGLGAPVADPAARAVDAAGALTAAVPRLLRLLDPDLAGDPALVTDVVRHARAIERDSRA